MTTVVDRAKSQQNQIKWDVTGLGETARSAYAKRWSAQMTSIAIREPGGPDMLVRREGPVPLPGEGEILVRVAAAGVNRPDVMQRQGHHPPPM